jgi:dihydroorotate dehydrogenase (NAD+) catalytic subunit
LKCVRKITETVDIPIIACGGISSAEDVRAYQHAGATIFGIGSALIGLSTEELKSYFQTLNQDLENGMNSAIPLLKTSDMGFTKYRLVENQRMADNLSLLVFDHDIRIQAGQFVFVWLPNVGEKPFSVLDHSPLTLAVQQRGCFTEKLCQLEPGNDVYIRGPYGVPVKIPEQANLILVSGGCGLAALYQIARETNNIEFFLGAKTKFHVFYVDKIRQFAAVNIATEDGSLGYQGMVTELLKQSLQKHQRNARLVFFNCGPEAMVKAAVKIEQQYTCSSKIYSAIDYITRCGVGICGSCASKDGRRLCVDGPFMSR